MSNQDNTGLSIFDDEPDAGSKSEETSDGTPGPAPPPTPRRRR